MTHRCVISVDATGIEPVHPRLTTPLWKIEGRSCAFCDSFPDYRSANQAGADGRPLLNSRFSGFGVAQVPTATKKDSQAFLLPHWRQT